MFWLVRIQDKRIFRWVIICKMLSPKCCHRIYCHQNRMPRHQKPNPNKDLLKSPGPSTDPWTVTCLRTWKVWEIQYRTRNMMGPSIMSVFGPRTELQSLKRDNPQSLWNHVTLSFTKSFWLKLRSLSFQGWPSGPSDLQAWDFWRFFWRLDKVSQKSGSQKVRLWKSFKQRS